VSPGFPGLAEEGEQAQGVDAGHPRAHGKVEVGTRRATRGADLAQDGPPRQHPALLGGNGAEVGVEAVQPQAVVEDQGPPGEEERVDQDHPPATDGAYGCASRGREVDAAVGRAWLAVQDPSPSEVAPRLDAVHGETQGRAPEPLPARRGEDRLQALLVPEGAGQVRGSQLDEVTGQRQPLHGKPAVTDLHGRAAAGLPVVRELERERPRGRLHVDPQQGPVAAPRARPEEQRPLLPDGPGGQGPVFPVYLHQHAGALDGSGLRDPDPAAGQALGHEGYRAADDGRTQSEDSQQVRHRDPRRA